MSDADKIMTLEEVADYLRVKPQTIYTWARRKKYLQLSWER
ncbi:MAG: helix-turn-helix domain-containing protein [Bacteroidetes bacterium]|nr:helix-turn-helix domain-containing protein [Bacteroidota bacterium]